MKSTLAVIIMIMMMLFCNACSYIEFFYFDYDQLRDNVECIELIRYHNSNVQEFKKIREEDVCPFDFEKMEILQVLDDTQEEAFWEAFTELKFVSGGIALDSPSGLCIRLLYRDGDFEIFSKEEKNYNGLRSYAGSFYKDGSVKRYIGTVVGSDTLIDNYFNCL